jgi:hypothetical protein
MAMSTAEPNRAMVDEALKALDGWFGAEANDADRPSSGG